MDSNSQHALPMDYSDSAEHPSPFTLFLLSCVPTYLQSDHPLKSGWLVALVESGENKVEIYDDAMPNGENSHLTAVYTPENYDDVISPGQDLGEAANYDDVVELPEAEG
ncbi:hypothetical protein SRHO_G00002790 [Serrasalmus rhombeus]